MKHSAYMHVGSSGGAAINEKISIRCHDFRVSFCTMCYEAGIPIKTLQSWMGHADAKMEVLLSRGNYAVF